MPQQVKPVRTVKGQVLTSTSLPSIRLKFDKHFKYAGTQKFVLYGRSQAEQFFFVDTDQSGQIQRMYLVQFEGYLPNTNATYDYAVTETVALNGQTYIANSESVPNVSALLKQEPESDAARAVTFLTNKGFHLPEALKYRRFVRLVDDAKRNEFILVYIEVASTAAAQQKPDNEFSARALKGVRVLNK
ncbi:MAG TPA: hypothetical protein VGK82_16385 [Pyrinomonadaceae bacterium]